MEETAHAASVKKPKRNGDTFLTARPWMRATTEMPHGKKSKRTRLPAEFWTALEKGLQHLSRDIKESTSPPLPFQIPFKNKIQLNGRTFSRDACPTSGSNSPPHTSAKKTRPTRTRIGPQIRHSNVGPIPSNMTIPQ
jgi:hypothetical protein